jgi:hypothetical protein
VLALFAFPTAAQHVTTHAAFEIAQVTESVVPTHRFDSGVSGFICGCHAFLVLVGKQTIKITAINISVEQFAVANVTLGQCLSSHHTLTY